MIFDKIVYGRDASGKSGAEPYYFSSNIPFPMYVLRCRISCRCQTVPSNEDDIDKTVWNKTPTVRQLSAYTWTACFMSDDDDRHGISNDPPRIYVLRII